MSGHFLKSFPKISKFIHENDQRFTDEVDCVLLILNKIKLEAYQLANFHIQRCCEFVDNQLRLNPEFTLDIESLYPIFPKVNQTVYRRCCAGVANLNVVMVPNPLNIVLDEFTFLQESIYMWQQNRKNYLPGVDIPNASGLSEFIAQLALEISTSATNHLIANCPKKIRKYLEIHYNHLYPVANQSRPSPRDGWELLNFIFKDDKKNKKTLKFYGRSIEQKSEILSQCQKYKIQYGTFYLFMLDHFKRI